MKRLENKVKEVSQNIEQKDKKMENIREKMRHRRLPRCTTPTNRSSRSKKMEGRKIGKK